MQRNGRFSVLVTNKAEIEKKWTVLKKKVRTVGIHVGLVILCITYIIGGAWLFYSLERPMELMIKEKTIKKLAYEKHNLLNNAIKLASHYEDFGAFNKSFLVLLDDYESFLFEVFSNPISASIFENEIDDLWTSSSAILFTATTLVPVGYGIVAPVTYSGRCCLIVYAIFGIPLALATMANLGKFVCAYLLRFLKKESIVMASITFISLLLLYPLLGSLIICISSSLSWLDSLYFCIMTIFMIGYGDMGPPIPTVFLVIFIVIGVMLVTISVDVVGANIIHHIHFMGRQMGKARIVAEKMVHMAQKISISKGLGLGVAQLGAFARIGALMHFEQTNNAAIDQKSNQPIIHELKLTTEDVETNSCCSKSVMLAFKPEIDDLDFVDKNMEVITPIRTVLSTNRLSWPSD